VTIRNKGLSDADSIELQQFIKGERDTTVDSLRLFIYKLQPGEGQASSAELRKDFGSFCMLIVVRYHWRFPGLPTMSFIMKKGYKVSFDSDEKEYTKVRLLDERQLKEEFENLRLE
jgi:hypothetical protein